MLQSHKQQSHDSTAVLFTLCCNVVGVLTEAVGSNFCLVGCFWTEALLLFYSALWIGFEGWQIGGLIFDGPHAVSLRPAILYLDSRHCWPRVTFDPATACFSLLLYPTVLSVLIIILTGISHTLEESRISFGERRISFERAETNHDKVASPKQQSNEASIYIAHNSHRLSSYVFLRITSENVRPVTQFMKFIDSR